MLVLWPAGSGKCASVVASRQRQLCQCCGAAGRGDRVAVMASSCVTGSVGWWVWGPVGGGCHAVHGLLVSAHAMMSGAASRAICPLNKHVCVIQCPQAAQNLEHSRQANRLEAHEQSLRRYSQRPCSSSVAVLASLGGGEMAFCFSTLPAMPMSMPATAQAPNSVLSGA